MEAMTLQAQEMRRDYKRRYRAENRDKINAQQREWRANNTDRVRQYNKRYWERKAAKNKNIRASWQDYGITKERYIELQEIVQSGEYDAVVRSAAYMADERVALHIILSVKRGFSYEALRVKWELGEIERMICGRTDFYGLRRLFFHYLDIAMKDMKKNTGQES